MRAWKLVCILVVAGGIFAGCASSDDPASYVTGLRVLAIKAEPPEIPVGATSTVTALALDTDGTPVVASWSRCVDAPVTGAAINPDCITMNSAEFLTPVGAGLSVTTTMPTIAASDLARPDASGGVYLPLIAHVSAGTDSLIASYLLRINERQPPNNNPTLTGLSAVIDAASDTLTPIDDTDPLVIHAGDQFVLRALFMPGSAETYDIYDGNPATTPPRQVTETLSVSWFSTAGVFEQASSGADVPDTILHLDQPRRGPTIHLPASGQMIDLWVVGRDERGGADYLHRTLQFE